MVQSPIRLAIKQLRHHRKIIDRAITNLEQLAGRRLQKPRRQAPPIPKAVRDKIATDMKRQWTKAKAAPKARASRLTASSRRKLSVAAKARWKAAKAQGLTGGKLRAGITADK